MKLNEFLQSSLDLVSAGIFSNYLCGLKDEWNSHFSISTNRQCEQGTDNVNRGSQVYYGRLHSGEAVTPIYWATRCATLGHLSASKVNFWVYFLAFNNFFLIFKVTH